MRYNIENAVNKNTRVLLFLSFWTLVLVKALLSLKFKSPWILPDEVSYAKMAGDIFGSVHPDLPWVYPLLLSIAYHSSANMIVVYHKMLFINCFLSSLILFPSYFIVSKYCPKGFAYMSAITIATLPSLTLYTFLLMTENFFVPLFVFSIWFLLEAYETERPFWIVLTILSVAMLFFTRHSGIFMIVGLAISLVYYLIFGRGWRDLGHRMFVKLPATISLILLVSSLVAFGLVLNRSNGLAYFKWMFDRAKIDGQTFFNLLKDAGLLKNYLILLQNEIGYLIIASYFIFFFVSLVFFYHVLSSASKYRLCPDFLSWFKSLDNEKKRSLASTSVYYLLTSVALVFATTISVYRQHWEIIGRYIDPIIPGFFIFGLIGLFQICRVSVKQGWGIIIFSLIFFLGYPLLTPNIITIYYINFLKSLAPNWMVFSALAAGFLLVLKACKNLGNRSRIFFAVLIIFSICTSAYTYQADLVSHSEINNARNQIGAYLSAHSNDNTPIIMDKEDSKKDWYFLVMTRFWAKNNILESPVNKNLSSLEKGKKDIYLITSKVLPLERLAVSTRGYYLYKYNSPINQKRVLTGKNSGNQRINFSISGLKFNDTNGNGKRDASEPGLSGWIIKLVKPDKTSITTTTNANGNYKFNSLLTGTYTVSEVIMGDWKQTYPTASGTYRVEITNADVTGKNFGNQRIKFSVPI